MLIVLAGTIGAGKSSLAAALGQHLGTDVFYEAVDSNPELYDYYKQVHSEYPEWYENYDVSPKIRIDGNKLDFVKNPEDLQHVLDTIDSELQKLDLL